MFQRTGLTEEIELESDSNFSSEKSILLGVSTGSQWLEEVLRPSGDTHWNPRKAGEMRKRR